jgi:hypothetical protein
MEEPLVDRELGLTPAESMSLAYAASEYISEKLSRDGFASNFSDQHSPITNL